MYGPPVQEEEINHFAGRVREELRRAYDVVRNRMSARLLREKELYDHKVHGKPYEKDSLVWLHSSVVKRGKSKKLHLPWSGPYRVAKKLSESTYRVQNVRNKRKKLVVHFDRLKPYLSVPLESENQPTDHEAVEKNTSNHPEPIQHQSFGQNLEVVEEDSPPVVQQGPATPQAQSTQSSSHNSTHRYPQRSRVPPDRFAPFVKH